MTDPILVYAQSVISKETCASRLVRLACARHLKDLETGPARGLKWDLKAAMRPIDFFSFLRLKSKDGPKPFKLDPFQKFIVGSLFGWKGEDGFRRFRTAYCEMGKGGGKSPLAAGIGLWGLVGDGESQPECFAAAVTFKQASIAFRDAKNFVENSPDLKTLLKIGEHNIANLANGGFFRPISSERRGLDGPRPHIGIIDELHEHPSSAVVDKVRAGTKGRKQAIIFIVTNSGYDRESPCWHHHEYSRDVLEGRIENDSWFAFVCGLDPCQKHQEEGKSQPLDDCPDCDQWDDEKVWPKANPGLGTIIHAKYLREQVLEAKGMPSKEGLTKRLNFCLWTEQKTTWLPAVLWAKGASPLSREAYRGRRCFGGLDLSSTRDITAFVLCFEWDDRFAFLPWFWIPRETALGRENQYKIPYQLWESRGLVKLTDGNAVDYRFVEKTVQEISEQCQLEGVAYDKWEANNSAIALGSFGVKMLKFEQNINWFNEPTKEFESHLSDNKIIHGDNSVLNWMASNVAVETDPAGKIRPVKPEHGDYRKIDGIVAAIMAFALARQNQVDGQPTLMVL